MAQPSLDRNPVKASAQRVLVQQLGGNFYNRPFGNRTARSGRRRKHDVVNRFSSSRQRLAVFAQDGGGNAGRRPARGSAQNRGGELRQTVQAGRLRWNAKLLKPGHESTKTVHEDPDRRRVRLRGAGLPAGHTCCADSCWIRNDRLESLRPDSNS